jgi:hypothetical protein
MLRRITIAFLLVGICLAQDNITRMDQGSELISRK